MHRTLQHCCRLGLGIVLLIALAGNAMAVPPTDTAGLKRYDTKYYEMFTDLGPEATREATLRMTRMAEEYHNRTRDFSGAIRQKFPFYLFSKASDYYAAGGPPGSAGVYMYRGDSDAKLMAIAGEQTSPETWHVIQHEGFHQFAHAVIGGQLPVWANEGLAEYFGESIFTGDGFVTGAIPPDRLGRIKRELSDKKLRSVRDMMLMTSAEWGAQLSIENYDQAWSMIHYLVQGEDGKYQKAFVSFMQKVGHGEPWDRAWLSTLGPADQFEPRWRSYWEALPDHPTPLIYAEATTGMLTSFLARAAAQKQTFTTFDDFKTAASAESGLKCAADDWLPHSMLESALRAADVSGTWSIEPAPGTKASMLVDVLEDGTRVAGSFVVRSGHVASVTTDVDLLPRIVSDAKKLADDGKKPQARALLTDGLKKYPKSTAAADARKLITEYK